MWSYYGSKSKIVDLYPKPRYNKIIEPFAGSARYALKWFENDVLLVDKYNVIVAMWKWLQQCSKEDILKLPEPKKGDKINRNDFDCIEAAWLMGFLIQDGVQTPMLTVSSFGSFDKVRIRKRQIASQLYKIKHWQILEMSYDEIENTNATWFVDPPYQHGGHKYKFSNKKIDFGHLSEWCINRQGQTIVCENTKADWMHFSPMIKIRGVNQDQTTEAIWSNIKTSYDIKQSALF